LIDSLQPADAAAAAQVIRQAFSAQSVPTDPPSSALLETTDSVAAQIEAGGGACIRMNGQLAGVVLWAANDGLYVGRLAVLPAWRGRGFARALVQAAEQEARRLCLARVHLSTRLVLAGNRRLFAACGYRETKLHAHPGYAAPTYVVMEKLLHPCISTTEM
jgi:GNAT superfamily N-acetyltransferase